jgi:DNA end-binding protein Ku
MAQQRIDSLSTEFDPKQYRDEYRERVLDLIERKAAGEEIAVQPAPEEPARVPDLMAALEASLDQVKEKTGGNGGPAKRRKGSAKKRSPSKAKAKAKAKK